MHALKPNIYVVDDAPSVREAVGGLIRSAGMRVKTFATAEEAWIATQAELPSALVLDVQLPGLDGLQFQDRLMSANIPVPIIFMTGKGDIPMSVRAMKAGALEFLTKPFDDVTLLNAIRAGLKPDSERGPSGKISTSNSFGPVLGATQPTSRVSKTHPKAEVNGVKSVPLLTYEICETERIVGISSSLKEVFSRIEKVAPTNSTVLLRGETGTGKELIARAIHKRSKRSSQPFVAVNCAAIPQSLIASELFGHEKGAFTGALQRRLGRFELAQGGTLFLDEIGELSPETQVMLLRVLQEREFERIGGHELVRADVRIITATHRDLESAIKEGTFRSDLFYRLNVFPIEILPLRDRREDIPFLVACCIRDFAEKNAKNITHIAQKSLELLHSHHWPGNVRELQNVLERSVINCEGNTLSVDESWMPQRNVSCHSSAHCFDEALDSRERELIEAALESCKGRISGASGAAARLGMPSSTLDSKILALQINKHRFKSAQNTE